MSKVMEERNEEIYRAIVEENRSFSEVAEKWGLTKQGVWAIVQMKERRLNGQNKQGELMDKIVYPGVQSWIVHHNMTIRYFCEFVCHDSVSTTGAIRRFLNGETGGNIRIIKDILQATGMSFEQAFMDSDTTSTNCTSDNDRINCINIKDFGFDLKEEREKRGLNQRTLAKELGISVQAYYRWEQGLTKQIRIENYNRLLEIFSTGMDTETEEESATYDIESPAEESKGLKENTAKRIINSRDKYRSLSDLGIDLFEERINHGWSQREVAEKLGVSILSYCRWETGKTLKVSHKSYKAIQRVFLNIG